MTPDRILTIALLLPVAAHATPCTGIVQVQPGDVSPCRGALVGADAIAAIAATRDAAAACGRDLTECRRRASLPLPQDCTPVFVEVPVPPVRVTVERTSWTAALVSGAVGLGRLLLGRLWCCGRRPSREAGHRRSGRAEAR
jgi:hypothetical protein